VSTADDRRVQMSARLREAREYLGLSQDDVAAALKLSRPAVTNIESGTRKVEAVELDQLAKLYRRSVDYFLTGKDEEISSDESVAFFARNLKGLSDKDLEEVARFANFLRSSSKEKPPRRGGR
jgi:transcriptional regulator with XRE-family HTH domain